MQTFLKHIFYPHPLVSVGNQKVLIRKEVKLIQICISTYVDTYLSNPYSKPVKILLFVCSGFNLILCGFCTKSTSAILLMGQKTTIKTTKFCRQVLPYWYGQNLIICQNADKFGVLFSKYSKSFHDIYIKLRVANTNGKFEATKQ